MIIQFLTVSTKTRVLGIERSFVIITIITIKPITLIICVALSPNPDYLRSS